MGSCGCQLFLLASSYHHTYVDNNCGVDRDGSMGFQPPCKDGDVAVIEEVAAVLKNPTGSLAKFSLVLDYLQALLFPSTPKFFLPILRQLWHFPIRIVWLLVVGLDRADERQGAALTERPPW